MGSGYGAAALDAPEQGLHSVLFSKIGSCDNPNFHDAGLAVAFLDKWIIDHMTDQKQRLRFRARTCRLSKPSLRLQRAAVGGSAVSRTRRLSSASSSIVISSLQSPRRLTRDIKSSRRGRRHVAIATATLLFLSLWRLASAQPPRPEFAPRGQRAARDIKYGDWQKVCFQTPGTRMVCRTTISGTFETGQSAICADLIERQGEGNARLQLFLKVGVYL